MPEKTVEYGIRRVWTHPPSEWDPEWWYKVGVPYFGSDEWGRRTIVVGLWFVGYVAWAYRTCWCAECHEVREQTYRRHMERKLAGCTWYESSPWPMRKRCVMANDSRTIADMMKELLEKYQDRIQMQRSAVVDPDWSRPPTLDIRPEEQMKRDDPDFEPPPREPRRHLTDIRSTVKPQD